MKKKIQDQIVEDALLREVIDDVKNEQLQQMWNKYGLYIIIGIALILSVFLSAIAETITVLNKRIDILEKKIEELEKRTN